VYRRSGAAGRPDLGRSERQRDARTWDLGAMLRYGRGGEVECLMHTLRSALGDAESGPCGLCPPEWARTRSSSPKYETV
jgi:hypothetical protein